MVKELALNPEILPNRTEIDFPQYHRKFPATIAGNPYLKLSFCHAFILQLLIIKWVSTSRRISGKKSDTKSVLKTIYLINYVYILSKIV